MPAGPIDERDRLICEYESRCSWAYPIKQHCPHAKPHVANPKYDRCHCHLCPIIGTQFNCVDANTKVFRRWYRQLARPTW